MFRSVLILAALVLVPVVRAADAPAKPSVMVLPFNALGDDDRHNWIGQAIHDNLDSELGRLGFQMVAPKLPAVLKSKAAMPLDTPAIIKIAKEGRADIVIFGSFQMNDPDLRITGQIVDVPSGKSLGALKANGPFRQLFTLEDALSDQVKAIIDVKPAPAAEAPPADAPPADAEPAPRVPATYESEFGYSYPSFYSYYSYGGSYCYSSYRYPYGYCYPYGYGLSFYSGYRPFCYQPFYSPILFIGTSRSWRDGHGSMHGHDGHFPRGHDGNPHNRASVADSAPHRVINMGPSTPSRPSIEFRRDGRVIRSDDGASNATSHAREAQTRSEARPTQRGDSGERPAANNRPEARREVPPSHRADVPDRPVRARETPPPSRRADGDSPRTSAPPQRSAPAPATASQNDGGSARGGGRR
jgi:TolB-like protein